MDELQLLRSTRSDETEMGEASFVLGRARLERAIADRGSAPAPVSAASKRGTELRAAQGRTWRPRIALVGAAAAAALVVGVAVLGPAGSGAEAQAAEILGKASAQVLAEDPALAAGQSLRVEERWETLGEAAKRPGEQAEPGDTIKFRDRERIVTYVPSDRSGDWTVRRSGRELVEVLDARGEPDAERIAREALAVSGPGAGEEVLPGGVLPGEDPAEYLEAPADAEELRAYALRRTAGEEAGESERIFEWLLPLVSNPAYPAQLRSAGFGVLAGLDGAEVTDEQIAFDGKKGVAVSVPSGESARNELVFDEQSGSLIGMREVLTSPTEWLAGLEAGAVLSSVVIDVSVVDTVPEVEAEGSEPGSQN